MLKITDKRKTLSPELLEHLRIMREIAAAKRKQTMLQKEEDAKKQVLSDLQEEEEPEETEQEQPVQKEVTKKKTRPVQEAVYHNPWSLNDEDIKIVKSYVQIEKEKRKKEKWAARKEEILSEVFNLLEIDSDDDEEPE